jgi:hypothetical protein
LTASLGALRLWTACWGVFCAVSSSPSLYPPRRLYQSFIGIRQLISIESAAPRRRIHN